MAGTAYTTRMPIGIAGAVTRPRDLTIEPVVLDHTKQFASYGLPGKYVNDQFVPLESGDTIDKVKGILVRPFPITSAADLAYIGVEANQVGDNLKRGYICVKVTAGNATAAKKGSGVRPRCWWHHTEPCWFVCAVAGFHRHKHASADECRGYGPG